MGAAAGSGGNASMKSDQASIHASVMSPLVAGVILANIPGLPKISRCRCRQLFFAPILPGFLWPGPRWPIRRARGGRTAKHRQYRFRPCDKSDTGGGRAIPAVFRRCRHCGLAMWARPGFADHSCDHRRACLAGRLPQPDCGWDGGPEPAGFADRGAGLDRPSGERSQQPHNRDLRKGL